MNDPLPQRGATSATTRRSRKASDGNGTGGAAKRARSGFPPGALTMACPYCLNPDYARVFPQCRNKDPRGIADLRIHFERRHTLTPGRGSTVQCPTCLEIFTGRNRHTKKDDHINERSCTQSTRDPAQATEGHMEGWSSETLDKMFDHWKTIKFPPGMPTDEKKWKGLFIALFPERKDSLPRSIYHFETPEEERNRQRLTTYQASGLQKVFIDKFIRENPDAQALDPALWKFFADGMLEHFIDTSSHSEQNIGPTPSAEMAAAGTTAPPSQGAFPPALHGSIIRGPAPTTGGAVLGTYGAPVSQIQPGFQAQAVRSINPTGHYPANQMSGPTSGGYSWGNVINPTVLQQDSPVLHQNPAVAYQNPSLVRQNPTVVYQNPTVAYQNPTVFHQDPAVLHQQGAYGADNRFSVQNPANYPYYGTPGNNPIATPGNNPISSPFDDDYERY